MIIARITWKRYSHQSADFVCNYYAAWELWYTLKDHPDIESIEIVSMIYPNTKIDPTKEGQEGPIGIAPYSSWFKPS